MPSERHRLSVERLTLSSAATSAVVIRATIGSALVVMIMVLSCIRTGLRWSVVGVSASPEFDGLVSVSVVKSAFGVAGDSLRSLLTPVPPTKGSAGHRVRPRHGGPGQSSRARAAEAAARAASPEVSQPMPANRQDPMTSVVSSRSWSWSAQPAASSPGGRGCGGCSRGGPGGAGRGWSSSGGTWWPGGRGSRACRPTAPSPCTAPHRSPGMRTRPGDQADRRAPGPFLPRPLPAAGGGLDAGRDPISGRLPDESEAGVQPIADRCRGTHRGTLVRSDGQRRRP